MSEIGPPGERLARAAHAAHDLSDALWEALHEELAEGPRAARAATLAQRLADVCSAIALLAAKPAPAAPAPMPLEPPEPSTAAGIEIHDTRGDEQPAHLREEPAHPAAWIGSISRRLERHREDRLPFAVLLVEVIDIDRLAHAESPPELARLTDHVERAIGAELRPADLLTRESLGRYWLVTPETDTLGARHLAERLARTVRLSARHRGVPLELAIGIAVCPDDGRDASVLAAHADVGVYAARAAGRSVAPADDPAA
ncbi:MAG TPA: diguanylate cyclase [Solirubrobacteraceae bacterium]|jgi:GGDEF domain-containing protein|nr:diguanylate cyclase [Solirubrobacteraceae bacterium]